MRRFKQWLILKLGGFLSQEVVEYRPIETESRELTAFAVRRDGMTRPEQLGDEYRTTTHRSWSEPCLRPRMPSARASQKETRERQNT